MLLICSLCSLCLCVLCADPLPNDYHPGGGVNLATKICVVLSGVRLLDHIRCLPSGEKTGRPSKPSAEGDARLVRAVVAHGVELVVLVAVGAGGVDDVLAVGVAVRAPVDVGVVGELPLVGRCR